jgi:hypothetical protein
MLQPKKSIHDDENHDYRIFKMNDGYEFGDLSDSDLSCFKQTELDEGQKMAVVNNKSLFIYIEE